MTEIIFEVHEDETDGGFVANALGFGIHTQAETREELRANVREAVDRFFDEGAAITRSGLGAPSNDAIFALVGPG